MNLDYNYVSPGYFVAMGIPVVALGVLCYICHAIVRGARYVRAGRPKATKGTNRAGAQRNTNSAQPSQA